MRHEKKLLSLLIVLMFALSVLSVDMAEVSAVEDPAIMVDPFEIVNSDLAPGEEFTVAINTTYDGFDIWGYEFSLSYNPNVLHGGINNTDTWAGDGVITSFNTSQIPVVSDSEKVYVNQTLMTKPANYTIAYDTGEIIFTFTATDTWIGDNVTTVFNTTITPVVPDSEKIYVDQTLMGRGYDYTVDYDTGEIEFIREGEVPGLGAEIRATYIYNAPGDGAEIQATYLYYGVTNGNLIVGLYSEFVPGPKGFNNTEGTLSLLGAYFYYTPPARPRVVRGPGILAYVTFTVVGKGTSNITIGPDTLLKGWTPTLEHYDIIDASKPPGATEPPYGSDHIQHGYFDNRHEHDVAVGSVTAQPKAAAGELVPINATVANIGKSVEVANITIRYDSTYIDSQNVPLLVGKNTTVSFSWNTTGLAQDAYTINATATIPGDGDLTDNWNTTETLVSLHNVAVGNIAAPFKAAVGDFVSIGVEVTNIGASDEVANVTIRYDSTYIDSQNVTLLVEKNATVSFSWNTTGLAQDAYPVNATATIAGDLDLTDNWNATEILILEHDVAVVNLNAPETAAPEDVVSIGVEVTNIGASDEEVVEVELSYIKPMGKDNITISIGSQNITLTKGESETAWFSWDTTGVPQGNRTVNATATIPDDGDLTDNENATIVLIAERDVEVKDPVLVPESTIVYVGELAKIKVLVSNLGVLEETFELKVTFSYDTTVIETQTQNVNLPYKSGDNFFFNWSTTNVAPGPYNITAEATIEGDVDPTNNKGLLEIIVKSPLGTIVGNVTNAFTGLPIAEASVTAGDYTNTTNAFGYYTISDLQPGNYTVTASANGYESASQHNITVVAGETTTANFTLRLISTITISAEPTTITVGDSTTINGSISPTREGVNVTIQYRVEGEEAWNDLTSVTTNENSQYSHAWTPETAGNYEVRASYLGDDTTSPAESDVQLITVQEASAIQWYLYVAAAGAVAIIIAAAFYFLKIRKPT